MLVFCNLANWSQYFLSKSDSSCTWAKWFANPTKNLEWHPGIGQWRHGRLPMMFTVPRFDINWIKPLMTRSLWLLKTGHRGHNGLVYHRFFVYAGDWIARGAHTRARLDRQQTVFSILNHIYLKTMNKWLFFYTQRKTLYIQCDTEKSRPEAKTKKAPSWQRRDKHTPTQHFSHHEEILLLLETKLILNVINYHVKVHWCSSFLTTLSGHSIVSCWSLKSFHLSPFGR